jgi:hypothetical protein
MKQFKMLMAVAMAGLAGLSLQASMPNGYGPVSIKMTGLAQNDPVIKTNGSTVTAKVTLAKIKITNKDILGLIEDEFGALPDGAQLTTAIMSSHFTVLDKDGNVLISNASSHTNSYALGFEPGGSPIISGMESESPTTAIAKIKYNMLGEFYYSNGTGSEGFMVIGGTDASVYQKETTAPSVNYVFSIKFSGAGQGSIGIYDFYIPSAKVIMSAKYKAP